MTISREIKRMSERMVGVGENYLSGYHQGYINATQYIRALIAALGIKMSMEYSGGENGMIRLAIKQTLDRIQESLEELGGKDA
jgi:hypothetical protein